MALFTYAVDGSVTPVNGHARRLAETGASDEHDESAGRWGCAVLAVVPALFFTWGFIGGLFNPVNYPLTGGSLAGGLALLALAVLSCCRWSRRSAARTGSASRGTPRTRWCRRSTRTARRWTGSGRQNRPVHGRPDREYAVHMTP